MNRRNDEQDDLNNINNIRREILQLCNAPGTETTDFHKLGFNCLLKKLHEIEHILTGLRDVPIKTHSTSHANRYQPLVTESEVPVGWCFQDAPVNPVGLSLSDDLTPHTRRVLLEIYSKIESSFDDFFENTKLKLKETFEDNYRKLENFMNSLRERQKAEVRIFMENAIHGNSNDIHQDTYFGDMCEEHTPQPTQVPQQAHMSSFNTPVFNVEAFRKTLECPGIDAQLKRQFIASLNGLNNLLSDILEQVYRKGSQQSEAGSTRAASIPEMTPQREQEQHQIPPFTCDR